VEVLHSEGVATHAGPELCGGSRKGPAEALAGGARAGTLSREIGEPVPGVHAVGKCGDNTGCRDIASGRRAWRGLRPQARVQALRAGTGRSRVCLGEMAPGAATREPRGDFNDGRTREVGQTHSTREALEQSGGCARGGGEGGGKGSGQGESATVPQGPDTEPGNLEEAAVADTASSDQRLRVPT
jgi:hypothetical protein